MVIAPNTEQNIGYPGKADWRCGVAGVLRVCRLASSPMKTKSLNCNDEFGYFLAETLPKKTRGDKGENKYSTLLPPE